MGFVLVQHLDPEHESALTQILSRATSLPVREITDHQPVVPNQVHVIPRDASLSIAQGVLRLGPRQKTRAPHRPIDAFFESLAQDQRDRAIGVVLSGTASDGTLGLEAIKAEGGITFAQDDSAKHDSMPRSAVAAGCVDLVLSPAAIAQELARIAKHPYAAGQPLALAMRAEDDRAAATAHEEDPAPLPSGGSGTLRSGGRQARVEASDSAGAGEGYKKILLLLCNHSGVDFSLYKSTTIQRRISRRMILTKHNTLAQYSGFLRGNAVELDALYSDVLISVTSFFRNPEMFDVLARKVLPALLEQRGEDPLRAWVLGCSTGQEAYSIAMSFIEVAEEMPRLRNLQIFATDLNDVLLGKARHGLYAKSLAEEISPERLRRFFIEEEGGYRIAKRVREMVVFARQNLIADPPFSRMDLVSCRNLLIYLEPSLQKKALPTFHYALRPHGFLLLGASESIGGFTDLFEALDKRHKVYSRKPAPAAPLHLPVATAHAEQPTPGQRLPAPLRRPNALESLEGARGELAAQREADRITVNQFAPPGVLVNGELQIVQFRGPTGAYLELPPGRASFDVLKMAREGLMLPLRTALEEARKDNKTARKSNVRVKQNGTTRRVNLEVIPLTKLSEGSFLILFEEGERPARAGAAAPAAAEPTPPPLDRKQERSRIAELETDLTEMRDYLQSMQEQHEAANEEQQAANEEIQSANEELQSVNEELETSKEELESANEELTTLNEEMSNRNVELNRLNNDLVNIQSSAQLAIVLLGRELAIRRFSAQAQKQFDLLATDVGRPIGQLRHNLLTDPPPADARAAPDSQPSPADLESIATEVISSVREQECEVRDRTGRWYSLRVHPYLTLDNKVDGAVLVLVDIDALKRGEQAITSARDYAENTLETVREPLLVLDSQLRVQSANRAFYRTFRVAPPETIGRVLYDLGERQWDSPRLRELLEDVLPQRTSVEDFLVERDFPGGLGPRTMLLNARRISDPQRQGERILLAIEDITERKRAEEVLRESHARLQSHTDELSRFNQAAVGREVRMIALKKEINELCRRYGEPARFPLDFEQSRGDTDGHAAASPGEES
jgi:two-component system, chemotaxis family, CheB/CheR fusion protein